MGCRPEAFEVMAEILHRGDVQHVPESNAQENKIRLPILSRPAMGNLLLSVFMLAICFALDTGASSACVPSVAEFVGVNDNVKVSKRTIKAEGTEEISK